MSNSSDDEKEPPKPEIRTAKELYDDKIALSRVGNDFPSHLQNICMNSIKFKLDRWGTKEQRPGMWTGLECEAGAANNTLGFCDSCMNYKYKRNPNDVV